MNVLLVFMGGGIGSVLRYGLAILLKPYSLIFPWATLLANGLSCMVLGATLALVGNQFLNEQQKLLLITGVCGGFSTFSTFTNETFQLYQQGNFLMALLNILVNLGVCLLCLVLGLKIVTI
jgi:fluoride exporter